MGYKKIIPKHPGANSSNMTMVGIGVDDPTTNLDVLGDVRIRDSQGLFFKRHGDDYAWRMRNESSADATTHGFDGSNDLVFALVSNSGVITGSGSPPPSATSHTVYGNSANTLVLKETGNVGIGTNNPQMRLHVGPGAQAIAALAGIGIANGSSAYSFFQASDGTKQYIAGIDHNIAHSKAGTLSNHDHAIITNNTNRIYIENTGNVGIGTDAPFTKLHVNGNILSEQVFVGGGRSDGTSATRVIGWYQGGSGDSSYTYRHIRTSLWGGGAALGNSQYIMGGFHIQSYRYYQGGGNSDAWITFHNWGGSAQNGYNYTYVGNWNADSYVYVDSTGYITLRLSNDIYQGHHVDLHQFPIYPARDIRITGIINSSSGTL